MVLTAVEKEESRTEKEPLGVMVSSAIGSLKKAISLE